MKLLILCFTLITSVQSFGMSLTCTGIGLGGVKIKLTAVNFVGDWLKDATAEFTDKDYNGIEVTEVGRSAQLTSDEKYKPTKYINHIRFDLSNMTEVKKFGKYYPGDQCRISVMIPKNAAVVKTFSAPTVVNCDQGGGSLTLSCYLK